MVMEFTLEYFTPSEAGEITGVNATAQRNWRNRGYLPETQGHARYNLFDLSEIMFMSEMGKRGIGPAQTKRLARISGLQIARCSAAQAVGLPDYSKLQSIEEGASLTLLRARTAKQSLMRLRSALDEDSSSNNIPDFTRIETGNTFIWFANDTECWDTNYESAIERMNLDELSPELSGPIIILELANVAARMAAAAPRPMLRFSEDYN